MIGRNNNESKLALTCDQDKVKDDQEKAIIS